MTTWPSRKTSSPGPWSNNLPPPNPVCCWCKPSDLERSSGNFKTPTVLYQIACLSKPDCRRCMSWIESWMDGLRARNVSINPGRHLMARHRSFIWSILAERFNCLSSVVLGSRWGLYSSISFLRGKSMDWRCSFSKAVWLKTIFFSEEAWWCAAMLKSFRAWAMSCTSR